MANPPKTEIPESWLDPSGWRPTPLQMSVSPEAVGIPYDRWMSQQCLATPEQIRVWLKMIEAKKKAAEAKKKR